MGPNEITLKNLAYIIFKNTPLYPVWIKIWYYIYISNIVHLGNVKIGIQNTLPSIFSWFFRAKMGKTSTKVRSQRPHRGGWPHGWFWPAQRGKFWGSFVGESPKNKNGFVDIQDVKLYKNLMEIIKFEYPGCKSNKMECSPMISSTNTNKKCTTNLDMFSFIFISSSVIYGNPFQKYIQESRNLMEITGSSLDVQSRKTWPSSGFQRQLPCHLQLFSRFNNKGHESLQGVVGNSTKRVQETY